jgi:hypothetical protein
MILAVRVSCLFTSPHTAIFLHILDSEKHIRNRISVGLGSVKIIMGACSIGLGELGGGCRATGLRKLHPPCRAATS